jgi:hypothetical protein
MILTKNAGVRPRRGGQNPDMMLWRAVLGVLPTSRPARLPHFCGKVGALAVYLVNGNDVKLRERKDPKSSHIGESDFMDFVEGGNGQEDPELCGPDQVFIDALIDPICWPFIAYHECYEAALMEQGASYDRAHEAANRVEKQLRKRFR